MPGMALDGMVFDVDGTLVDSNGAHVEAWRRAFERHGYKIPPDRIAGFRMYQDLSDKTWGINLKTDPDRFRVKLITLTANGSIFSKKKSELSTEKGNLNFQGPSEGVGFYEGCTLIPRNFYGL